MIRDRTSIDLVVITLTAMVAVTIIIVTVGAIVAKIVRPEMDVNSVGALLSHILNTVVGALVGFVGGRAQGRMEGANGTK